MKRIGVLLATAGGVGYSPFAPGTAGSAAGLVVYALTWSLAPGWQIAIVVAVSVVGLWAAGVAARHFGREDPGEVVIDEVAGQLVTLLLTGAGLGEAAAGFLLFRVLDVVKPWPAGRFERLPGGLGIMADDLMAGVYGNLALRLGVLLAHLALPGTR
jgi:phosphatidylglycerophosphatase A